MPDQMRKGKNATAGRRLSNYKLCATPTPFKAQIENFKSLGNRANFLQFSLTGCPACAPCKSERGQDTPSSRFVKKCAMTSKRGSPNSNRSVRCFHGCENGMHTGGSLEL